MHSDSEPNSFFGGMAVNSWNSLNKSIADPIHECSWLFKLECEGNKYFNIFIIIKESIFINGNALIRSVPFKDMKVQFFNF